MAALAHWVVRIIAVYNWIEGLSRRRKRVLLIAVDATVLPFCLLLAVILRQGSMPSIDTGVLLWWPAVVLATLPVLVAEGMYRSVVRFVSQELVYRSLAAVGVAVLGLLLLNMVMPTQLPWTSLLIFWGAAVAWVQWSRLLARNVLRHAWDQQRERVIIWGAGLAGCQLARYLQDDKSLRPVAFVDQSTELQGAEAHGLRVHAAAELPNLVATLKVGKVIIAVPKATAVERAQILEQLEPLAVEVLIAPESQKVLAGGGLSELREVVIDDLLDRDPVQPDEELLKEALQGRNVLVTGAGGSIGSELCRQIARRAPQKLVLFEHSEFALYAIERELRESFPMLDLVAVLGSIVELHDISPAISDNAVDLVYHAAAYKHVPMVEKNPQRGLQNNVLGTINTARAAVAAGVSDFVLVSTDKAVRPTNVMGTSKRIAEQFLQLMAVQQKTTRFSMVRFGNVLGSSGSVVPLFREQIRRGGPITVTHRDVIRYFMTIPEAAQLVIQAGAMAEGGDVFLLDMGEPVNISKLAERMIRLTGRTVAKGDKNLSNNAGSNGLGNGDIEIRYTGLRPGEKLFEELLIDDTDVPTDHPRIRRAIEHCLPEREFNECLAELTELCAAPLALPELLTVLKALVPEYKPSSNTAIAQSSSAVASQNAGPQTARHNASHNTSHNANHGAVEAAKFSNVQTNMAKKQNVVALRMVSVS